MQNKKKNLSVQKIYFWIYSISYSVKKLTYSRLDIFQSYFIRKSISCFYGFHFYARRSQYQHIKGK